MGPGGSEDRLEFWPAAASCGQCSALIDAAGSHQSIIRSWGLLHAAVDYLTAVISLANLVMALRGLMQVPVRVLHGGRSRGIGLCSLGRPLLVPGRQV